MLLDFPNVIAQNGSNYYIKKRFCGGCDAQKNFAPFYQRYFHNGSIVVFFFRFIGDVKRDVSDVQRNASEKNHRRAALPVGSRNGCTKILIK